MKTLKNIQLSDFDLNEEFEDDIFVELSAAGDDKERGVSATFNSLTSNWASVGAALSALASKGPGNATNTYTELKCC